MGEIEDKKPLKHRGVSTRVVVWTGVGVVIFLSLAYFAALVASRYMLILADALVAILLVAALTAGFWWRSGVEAARRALLVTAWADLAAGPVLFLLAWAWLPHTAVYRDWFGFIVILLLFLPGPMFVAELAMFFGRKLDMRWTRLLKRLVVVLLPAVFPWLFIGAIAASAGV